MQVFFYNTGMNAGRPSELNDELTFKIRKEVLNGESYKSIQEKLDIDPDTWDGWVWRDYKGFRENLNSWKKERLLKKTEALSEEILDTPHGEDTRMLSIKQKESEFIRETLGKEFYSKRNEVTGANGESINIQVVNYADTNSTQIQT